jgi:hypothetical protein
MSKINSSKSTALNKTNDAVEAKEKFIRRIVHKNSIATNHIRNKDFDVNKSKHESNDALLALGAHEGLQSMLVAQMLSIHDLQQRTAMCAIISDGLELKQTHINLVVKLTNCFTQQANMLAKLQGIGGQKIIVEHVEVHPGGQAVVGNIQGGMGNKEKT